MKGSKDKLSCTHVPLLEAERQAPRQVFDVTSQVVSAISSSPDWWLRDCCILIRLHF